MSIQITCLCTPDWWILAMVAVPAFIGGIWFGIRLVNQDDFPQDDPHARPFAGSEGGRNV